MENDAPVTPVPHRTPEGNNDYEFHTADFPRLYMPKGIYDENKRMSILEIGKITLFRKEQLAIAYVLMTVSVEGENSALFSFLVILL